MLDNVLNSVHLEQIIHSLHNNCQSFKAHTRINIRICKRVVVTCLVFIKLRKYKVPDLHKSVTVTAYTAGRLTASVFFTSVIVYFRAWSARACAMLPEIILFAKLYDMCRVNSYLVYPDSLCLVVLLIHRHPKLIFRDFHYLCEKLPRPLSCLVLEIVAKREITKHLKECAVTCSFADSFNIRGSYTFLTRCNSASWRFLCQCKPFLHRCHT